MNRGGLHFRSQQRLEWTSVLWMGGWGIIINNQSSVSWADRWAGGRTRPGGLEAAWKVVGVMGDVSACALRSKHRRRRSETSHFC